MDTGRLSVSETIIVEKATTVAELTMFAWATIDSNVAAGRADTEVIVAVPVADKLLIPLRLRLNRFVDCITLKKDDTADVLIIPEPTAWTELEKEPMAGTEADRTMVSSGAMARMLKVVKEAEDATTFEVDVAKPAAAEKEAEGIGMAVTDKIRVEAADRFVVAEIASEATGLKFETANIEVERLMAFDGAWLIAGLALTLTEVNNDPVVFGPNKENVLSVI